MSVKKSVLFLSIVPHSREDRLAECARLAGWEPHLISLAEPKFDWRKNFSSASQPGSDLNIEEFSLIHAFASSGDQAAQFVANKLKPTILDIYDPISTQAGEEAWKHQAERWAIENADGITHRDLRIKTLQRAHGWRLPQHNLFLYDPLPAVKSKPKRDGIRVVSIGWIGKGDTSAMKTIDTLCYGGIHVHIFFNRYANGEEIKQYLDYAYWSPYLHIEEPVYGQAYWDRLREFDFGLAVSDRLNFNEPFEDYDQNLLRTCGSSRIADYIAAGLGIIHSPGLKFQNFIARRYAPVVVPVDKEFLASPRRALQAAANSERKDVSAITTAGVAQRLGRFYEEVLSDSRAGVGRSGSVPIGNGTVRARAS